MIIQPRSTYNVAHVQTGDMDKMNTSIVRAPYAYDEVHELDAGFLVRLFKHNRLKIVSVALGIFIVGALFSLSKPEHYVSESTVYLNTKDIPGVIKDSNMVTALDKGGIGLDLDPFKSQLTLLQHPYLLQKTFEAIQQQLHLKQIKSSEELKGIITPKNIPSTEFFQLRAKWTTPETAQRIAQIYLDTYRTIAEGMNKAPLEARQTNLEQQLTLAQQQLDQINLLFQNYKQSNKVINPDAEETLILKQFMDSKDQYAKDNAKLAALQSQSQQLQGQLHLDPRNALNAVATGTGSSLYPSMLAELNNSQRQYKTLSSLYTPNMPQMKQLQDKISTLKKQIADYEKLTLGSQAGKTPVVIMDNVRNDLVKDLATTEVEHASVAQQQRVDSQHITALQNNLQQFPAKEGAYINLQLKQRYWINVVKQLKDSLADVTIQRQYSKIFVLSPPTLPTKPAFPDHIQRLLLLGIFSCLASLTIILGPQYLKTIRRSYVENTLGVPVLAIIPWVSAKATAQDHQAIVTAYETLALNLNSLSGIHQQKAFAVTSLFYNHRKDVSMLVNMAKSLGDLGQRVLLVEANLHTPKLAQAFGYSSGKDGLFKVLEDGQADFLQQVQYHIRPIAHYRHLDFLDAGILTHSAFKYFNHKGLEPVIEMLKTQYDWILFDVPPLLENTDVMAISNKLDGILVFVENNATKDQLQTALEKITKIRVTVSGCILREIPSGSSGYVPHPSLLENWDTSAAIFDPVFAA